MRGLSGVAHGLLTKASAIRMRFAVAPLQPRPLRRGFLLLPTDGGARSAGGESATGPLQFRANHGEM